MRRPGSCRPSRGTGRLGRAWSSAVKQATGAKGKDLFSPLRLALTGREHGPELKHLLPLIGRDRAVARLEGQDGLSPSIAVRRVPPPARRLGRFLDDGRLARAGRCRLKPRRGRSAAELRLRRRRRCRRLLRRRHGGRWGWRRRGRGGLLIAAGDFDIGLLLMPAAAGAAACGAGAARRRRRGLGLGFALGRLAGIGLLVGGLDLGRIVFGSACRSSPSRIPCGSAGRREDPYRRSRSTTRPARSPGPDCDRRRARPAPHSSTGTASRSCDSWLP